MPHTFDQPFVPLTDFTFPDDQQEEGKPLAAKSDAWNGLSEPSFLKDFDYSTPPRGEWPVFIETPERAQSVAYQSTAQCPSEQHREYHLYQSYKYWAEQDAKTLGNRRSPQYVKLTAEERRERNAKRMREQREAEKRITPEVSALWDTYQRELAKQLDAEHVARSFKLEADLAHTNWQRALLQAKLAQGGNN